MNIKRNAMGCLKDIHLGGRGQWLCNCLQVHQFNFFVICLCISTHSQQLTHWKAWMGQGGQKYCSGPHRSYLVFWLVNWHLFYPVPHAGAFVLLLVKLTVKESNIVCSAIESRKRKHRKPDVIEDNGDLKKLGCF